MNSVLQAHERARQGRLRYQFMKEIREMKERSTIKPEAEEKDEASGKLAALKIQKVWRGYVTRRWVRKRRLEEMLLIGNGKNRKSKYHPRYHRFSIRIVETNAFQRLRSSSERSSRLCFREQERSERKSIRCVYFPVRLSAR